MKNDLLVREDGGRFGCFKPGRIPSDEEIPLCTLVEGSGATAGAVPTQTDAHQLSDLVSSLSFDRS